MTQSELDKLKTVQLEIMDKVHDLCTENSITYYLVYGTLLGAVRHKGFIPWDVDIDIAMPRADYEKFKKVCKEKLADGYVYCDYDYSKHFMQPHALVCKKGTNVYTGYDFLNPIVKNHGIYIDVFPLDKTPDDKKERAKHNKRLKRLSRLHGFAVPYSYSKNPVKRKLHHILSGLLFFVTAKKTGRLLQKEMSRYRDGNCKCLSTLAGEYEYNKQCIPLEFFGTPTPLEFEGRKYNCPQNPHGYLSQMYGDYMTPPPPEKRAEYTKLFTKIDF